MKHTRVLLCFLFTVVLCGCMKTEGVKSVEEMIAAIGPVSSESDAAIQKAFASYEALPEEEQAKVENYAVLTNARDQYLMHLVAGDWFLMEDGLDYVPGISQKQSISLNADGSAEGSHIKDNATWYVSDERVYLVEEEIIGYYKIVRENNGITLKGVYGGSTLITRDDYESRFSDIYTVVELTPENVTEYCQFELVEVPEEPFSTEGSDIVWTYLMLSSKLYESDWIYLDVSDDFLLELVIPEHEGLGWGPGYRYTNEEMELHVYFTDDLCGCAASAGGLMGYEDGNTGYLHKFELKDIQVARVEGTVTYVKKDHVQEVRQHGFSRELFINGRVFTSNSFWPDFDY